MPLSQRCGVYRERADADRSIPMAPSRQG